MLRLLLVPALAVALAGCAMLPGSGPTTKTVQAAADPASASPIQVVDVDDAIARRLLAREQQQLFSEAFGPGLPVSSLIGPGDALEISLWEAPPATLFGAGFIDPRLPATSHATALPEQVVDREGFVSVPFAGRIKAAGLTVRDIEAQIVQRLKGKANQPEALVRLVRNASTNVTVVGEVATSLRMPLTPGGERLLDALAAAGGARQPINKTSLQLTRGAAVHTLPLEVVIRDPRQNVALQPGDVVTALFESLSFTALGATGRNQEIGFETQGITLAQALARAGGLVDSRANPEGAFIFRLEPHAALPWPRQPAAVTPEGQVPVVYRFDLRDPSSFFVMQSFRMRDRDVLFVSNSPATELQKFLSMVGSAFYPAVTVNALSN